MKDQKPTPAVDGPGDARRGTRGRRLRTAALLAVFAVLVAFGAVMTLLYARESGALADREREVAARTTELEATRTQLSAALARPTLEPQVYEAIRACVAEALVQLTTTPTRNFDYVSPQQPTLPAPAIPGAPPGPPDPAIAACEQALQYVK